MFFPNTAVRTSSRAHMHPRAFNRWRHFSTMTACILITSLAIRGGGSNAAGAIRRFFVELNSDESNYN